MQNVDGFMFDSYSYIPNAKAAWYHSVPFAFTADNLINHYNFIGLQNIFFRASLYKSYCFDPKYKYAMDYELYLHMLSEHSLFVLHIHIPSTINISDGNLSSNVEAGKRESDEIIRHYNKSRFNKCERGFFWHIIHPFQKHKSMK